MTTLRTIKPGETVRVAGINGKGAIKRRVMDMGITKGVDVFVRKVAPLGDPVEVTVRGYELSLRKADADIVEVAEVQEL
ncbi:MAG: ferrous iron transport protein A [Clostridiales Family XIII bacterium]|jgi:ferrous iron transport protein A|nr:ferrous iron transport protein A [Clostridiales Family XIII bacterium]